MKINTKTANEPIAKNVSEIIRELGIKQKVIAERAGYSENVFSNMLNGRKTIKACDIPRIAKALNRTPNALYGVTDNQAS